jgi:hypothetical protein
VVVLRVLSVIRKSFLVPVLFISSVISHKGSDYRAAKIPETNTQVLTKGWYNPWGLNDALTLGIINTFWD